MRYDFMQGNKNETLSNRMNIIIKTAPKWILDTY
jgi:hypothetical protein